jgi:hypothetical protein
MPRTSARGPLAVLAALTAEPTSTSDLYERMGYPALMNAGLIPYHAFRRALVELEAEGLAASSPGEDETTLWALTERGAELRAAARGRRSDPPPGS